MSVRMKSGFWRRAALTYRAALESEQEVSRNLMDALERSQVEYDRLVARLEELEGRLPHESGAVRTSPNGPLNSH